MTRWTKIFSLLGLLVVVAVAAWFLTYPKATTQNGPGTLRVAISPYQDIGMVVNLKPMGLEKKYGVNVELKTLAWEEIVPAVASAGSTVDLGYASLIGYLTKQDNLNRGSDDEVIFIYPAYVFKGGGFISYDKSIRVLSRQDLANKAAVREFFSHRIGAEKNSLFDMLLYRVAKGASLDPKDISVVDSSLDSSLLAARNGDLSIASAGLTQLAEARRDGGRLVLSMDDAGFADITGFITTRKRLAAKHREIEAFIRMWFDTVNYVMTDPRKNSAFTRAYLNQHAATKYSADEYAEAVGNEFFPRSVAEMNDTLLSRDGPFSMEQISTSASDFLVDNGVVKTRPVQPSILQLKP